ncbi:hypothetical protein [Furfurilactobacillus entadae]|uniref:hypothetical protein n=1 Tax=Furfurilactobacillus entadae TaxID=2922307 RepID=UPI0035EC77E7
MTKEQRLIKQYQAVRIAKMGFAVVIFACIAWMATIPTQLIEWDFEGKMTPKIVREASRSLLANSGQASKLLHGASHTFLSNFVVLMGATLLLGLFSLVQRRLRNKIGESLEADCFQDVFTNENG